MTLGALFPGAFDEAEAALPVTGVTMDSRAVAPGFVFVAYAGAKLDGAAFIPDALAKGAAAVLGEAERPAALPSSIPYARVPDARRALSLAAARVHPRQPETIVAVTGTSGKSSWPTSRARSTPRSGANPRASARSAS